VAYLLDNCDQSMVLCTETRVFNSLDTILPGIVTVLVEKHNLKFIRASENPSFSHSNVFIYVIISNGYDSGKGKVDAIRYVTTRRLYLGLYGAEIITTQLEEGNVSQLLQHVGFEKV